MQTAETLLLLFAAGNLLYFIIGKKPEKRLAFVGLILLAIHLIFEEPRWQVLPAYLVFGMITAVHFFNIRARKWLRVINFLLGLVLVILSTALCYALPVFKPYEPTGPYTVGFQQQYFKDQNRPEDITTDPNDHRELMVDVYYPSTEADGERIPYLLPVERKGFTRKYGLPDMAFGYLDGIKTKVYADLEPAEGSFPILIFSPGYYTPASGYHSIVTDLASHGFIVFSINHSYETIGSRFPDGREIFYDQDFAAQNYWSDAMTEAVGQFDNATTEADKYAAVQQANEVFPGGTPMVARWAADIRSVLDGIEQWNSRADFLLAGKMKLNEIGVLGHSRGGAAAIEASIYDERIKASANLDGAQWGHVIDTVLHKPTALFSSTNMLLYDVNEYIFQKSKGDHFYDVAVANTGHSNFSDIPYMVRVPQLNEAGSIAPEAATLAFNRFLLAFFKKHLLDGAVDMNKVVAEDVNLDWKE